MGRSNKVVSGSLFLLLSSWINKFLAIISTIVLARYLSPEDYGIAASCFLTITFFQMLTNMGSRSFVLRQSRILDSDLNRAFTIDFISKAFISFLLFFNAKNISVFLEIPEATDALRVIALSPLFIGMKNPGIYRLEKQFNYKNLGLIETTAKLLSTFSAIAIAITTESYWAIVIADIVFYGLNMLMSFVICAYRPKFEFSGINQQLHFSKWLIIKGMFGYIKGNIDRIILAKSFTISQLGIYNFSQDASGLAKKFIFPPIIQIMYPSLSSYLTEPQKLSANLTTMLLILSVIYIPFIFGGFILAQPIITIVFGEKWLDAVPIFQLMMIMTGFQMIIGPLTNIFTLLGKLKQHFLFEVVTAIIIIAVMLLAVGRDLFQFTLIRTLLAALMALLLGIYLNRFIDFKIFKFIGLLIPIFCACTLMNLGLTCLANVLVMEVSILILIINVFCGGLIYSLTMVVFVVFLKRFDPHYADIVRVVLNPILKKIGIVRK